MSYLANFNSQILGLQPTLSSVPKIVFLHGLMGFGSNWKTIARRFDQDHQILLYDQRGHGRSFHPSSYTLKDYADDLHKILLELGWSKICLVGHSLGGRVALEFAAHYSSLIEKLVMVDIGPVADLASMYAVEEKLRSVPVPFVSRDQARAFFDGPFLNKYKSELLKQFFYANIDKDDQGQMNWRFDKEGILETLRLSRLGDQWSQIKKITKPTLVIRGENSKDLSQEIFEEMKAANPLIQGAVIPGAGHWVHVEKPQETIQLLEAFLHNDKVSP